MFCLQVGGRPGAHWTEIKEKARPFSLISTMSLSLFLLSHSSLPPHDFHQPFTIFQSILHQIHLLPSSPSSYFSLVLLGALSLFLSSERNEGGRRPMSSIKLLPSFATQGNSLSSKSSFISRVWKDFDEDLSLD